MRAIGKVNKTNNKQTTKMVDLKRAFWILFNRTKFSFNGVKYGQGMRICHRIYLKLKGDNNVTVGNNFGFSSGGGINCLARNIRGAIELEAGAKLTIGNNVGISSSCLWVFDYLKIGNDTKIGADCIILDSDTHSLNYLERMHSNTDRPNAKRAGITIGNNVLLGTRCIVLKGVEIGDRTIIGSGSIVTKSIPPDCIAAGNPCKVIKYINNEQNSNTANNS